MKNQKVLGHLTAVAVAILWLTRPAEASFIINIVQSGPNVVGTGSGSFNLAALAFGFTGTSGGAEVGAAENLVSLGPATANDFYTGSFAISPSGLGATSTIFQASSGAGPTVGLSTLDGLEVPFNYVSGTPIAPDSATWNNTTLAGLGLTPGTYVYSWGTGLTADTLTLNVGAATPEPASLALVALGGLGLALVRRRRKQA
jgi:PEP-CTERM motif-containing protein